MSSAMGIALSGLRAFETKLSVNANNIANVNTNGFKKSRASMQEAANGGVQVTLSQVNLPGFPVGIDEQTREPIESSNVDLAEEMVEQMITRYAFEANVITIKTAADMQQTLLDILS